jgi:uncharacterized protein (TIGR02145 family)
LIFNYFKPKNFRMKQKNLLFTAALFIVLNAAGQKPTLELGFTAIENESWLPLDSIRVMNLAQAGDTVLYWPDTVLNIFYTGINEIKIAENDFRVLQNYPNPFTEHTVFSISVPEKDHVYIMVTDAAGRQLVTSDEELERGLHSFRFIPGNEKLSFFTAQWRGKTSSIKGLQTGNRKSAQASLVYLGMETPLIQAKSTEALQAFPFTPGDKLLFIGYANGLQTGMVDEPDENQLYTMQFATNIPCPGMATVEYEGQIYNTIQIFSQCWLKENLNVGTMIIGSQNQTDNGIVEKFCYNDEPDSCIKYGGLYQWDEMTQYTSFPGVQGICPPGWHIPDHDEWKIMEGAVDSLYKIGNPAWNNTGYRGYNAGTNLKSVNGWTGNGNGTDLYGFTAMPAGYRSSGSVFDLIGNSGYWWSSTEYSTDYSYNRSLMYDSPEIRPDIGNKKTFGVSVRCIRDQ